MRVPGIESDPERGQRIKSLRLSMSQSQKGLARLMKVDPKTIWTWEQGGPLDHGHLRTLAAELHTTDEFLLTGVEPVDVEIDAYTSEDMARLMRRITAVESRQLEVGHALGDLAAGVEGLIALLAPVAAWVAAQPPQASTKTVVRTPAKPRRPGAR